MSLDPRVLAVFDEFQSGRLSRRQFVQRLVGLGFASSTIALFLAACGGAAATPDDRAGGDGCPDKGHPADAGRCPGSLRRAVRRAIRCRIGCALDRGERRTGRICRWHAQGFCPGRGFPCCVGRAGRE